jgi:flavodoxin
MMKALVVFDSTWGNTEKIAQAVASGIGAGARACRVGEADAQGYGSVDLLVLGSPILGGRPSQAMQGFINGIPRDTAKRLTVATFDTRLLMRFAKLFGFAAVRMADQLKEKGSALKSSEGFFVQGRSGPLADGELDRAAQWGRTLSRS